MLTKLSTAAALVAALALSLAGGAVADTHTLDDLRALGYTVALASDLGNGCTVWYVSGFGNSSYVNDCNPDGFIDSWANPAAHTERKWQFEHPDELTAKQALERKGYTVTRPDPLVISFAVSGGATALAAVDGTSLVSLAATLPDLTVVVTTTATTPSAPPAAAAAEAPVAAPEPTSAPAASEPVVSTTAIPADSTYAELQARVAELEAQVATLQEENAALRTELGLVSTVTPDGYAPAGVIYA